MAISGSDLAITPARSGLLRAGAGRSGWPIPVGARVPLYAMAGVARSGAIRSNYHSNRVFLAVNGVHYATGRASEDVRISVASLRLSDPLREAPSTIEFAALGFVPVVGQSIVMTLGSKDNLVREFGGRVLQVAKSYITDDTTGDAAFGYTVSGIDFTWGLDKRTVTGYFTGSATTIAEALISTYATDYTASVEQGLPTVDGGITFTNQTLTGALSQLCRRFGGDWFCDYDMVVRVFSSELSGVTNPTIINGIHPTAQELVYRVDLSQVVTRVQVEGGGSTAMVEVAPGETVIPVATADWYDNAGGVVVSGPQRITYGGRSVGGGGGLVGPGATPSAAPSVAPSTGAGVDTGAHSYAVTFVTAAGESLPGPTASIEVGLTSPPSAAPTLGAPTIGSGPDAGSHDYAVTFVTASGETTASPLATQATDLTPAPTVSPTPGTPTLGGSVDAGAHDYAVSFVTAIGETTPSAISGAVVAGGATSPPASAPTPGTATLGGSVDAGTHDYAVTFVTAAGETTPGVISGPVVAGEGTAAPGSAPTVATPSPAGSVDAGAHDYVVTFTTAAGETTPGPISASATTEVTAAPTNEPTRGFATAGGSVDNGTHKYKITFVTAAGETTTGPASEPAVSETTNQTIPLSGIQTGGANVVARRIYRQFPGVGSYKLVTTIPDNTTTTYNDTASNASLGADEPATNTSVFGTVALSAIPTGTTGVTGRKIYRRFDGAGTFKLLATIANNSTTTYTDTTANSGLGADAPSVNTSTANTVPLTGIPTGPAVVTSRKIYRRFNGSGTFKLLTTIANNTTTTYSDTTANSSLGADAPSVNTSTANTVPLTGIPVGDANVTARKLYRRSGGAGLKLLATIADNTTTTYSDTAANSSLGASPLAVSTAYLQRIPLTNIPTGPALVTSRKIYRTTAGGAQLKLAHTLADNTTTAWTDTVEDASLGANVPTSNTATANQVAVSSIPIGAAAVTSRKLYRTTAGGAQLKLLATIADNTTTTYTDSTADGSLGADAPGTDTSGLPQPAGQVIPGETSLVVADTGGFRASGGWAVIGNGEQVIRYSGITASSLTGIPASGAGAIVAAIGYNSTATDCAVLTGVPASGEGAIRYTIRRGDDVNIFVTSDNLVGQVQLAVMIGGDGVQEEYVQDRRLAKAECLARGAALLALKSLEAAGRITYTSRDINTRAGRTVQVNLGPPFNVSASFLIQQVTQSYQATNPPIPPLYSVEAGSDRLTFEQLLRIARGD